MRPVVGALAEDPGAGHRRQQPQAVSPYGFGVEVSRQLDAFGEYVVGGDVLGGQWQDIVAALREDDNEFDIRRLVGLLKVATR